MFHHTMVISTGLLLKQEKLMGAILRITSFLGGSMHEDDEFAANLSGCCNTGMPFGIYV